MTHSSKYHTQKTPLERQADWCSVWSEWPRRHEAAVKHSISFLFKHTFMFKYHKWPLRGQREATALQLIFQTKWAVVSGVFVNNCLHFSVSSASKSESRWMQCLITGRELPMHYEGCMEIPHLFNVACKNRSLQWAEFKPWCCCRTVDKHAALYYWRWLCVSCHFVVLQIVHPPPCE